MITEVYDAFRAGGTPDFEARKAAEALSSTEPRLDALDRKMELRFAEADRKTELRFAEADRKTELRFSEADRKTELRFAKLEGDIDRRFARVDGELALLKWMLGVLVAMVVAILFLLIRH